MNLGSGVLMFMGFILIIAGTFSKLTGISLLEPLISSNLGYLAAASICFLLTLIVDRFQKD